MNFFKAWWSAAALLSLALTFGEQVAAMEPTPGSPRAASGAAPSQGARQCDTNTCGAGILDAGAAVFTPSLPWLLILLEEPYRASLDWLVPVLPIRR
jgi:hypothetical protein